MTASTERSAPKALPRTKPKPPPLSATAGAVPSADQPLADPVVPVAATTLSDTAAAAAATATRHPGSASSTPLDPAKLVGLDEEQTQRLLGSPTRTGEEPPARYWQYANERCVLRVLFFMDVTTQDFRALSYDLKSSDDDPNVRKQCFAQLLAQADPDAR